MVIYSPVKVVFAAACFVRGSRKRQPGAKMTEVKADKLAAEPLPDLDKQIAHIDAVSKIARGTWFSLIVVLLFSAIAVAGVRDRDYFTFGSVLVLPVIGVPVPIRSFFIAAPLIVLGLYTYLHLYLTKLWRALAEVQAGSHTASGLDRPLDDLVFPWLVSDAAIAIRPGARIRPFSKLIQLVAFVFLWSATPFVMMLYWWRSFPLQDPMFTGWIGLLTGVSLIGCFVSFRYYWITLRGDGGPNQRLGDKITKALVGVAVCISAALMMIGVLRTSGSYQIFWLTLGRDDLIFAADLKRAELVERPAGWLPYDEAFEDFKSAFSGIKRKDFDPSQQTGADWIEAAEAAFKTRRQALLKSLRANDFPRASLRGANLIEAYLPGLDLAGADLRGAGLDSVTAEGADLGGANLANASLKEADMRDANLWRANLEGADLDDVNLRGAVLLNANLSRANLENALLEEAILEQADLSRANLMSADFTDADMREAIFTEADLTGANFQRGILWGANLNEAETGNASFQEALLVSADFTFNSSMTQEQLNAGFGDKSTSLPDHLVRPDHWVEGVLPENAVIETWKKWRQDERN